MIDKKILTFILDIHENAEMFNKMDILTQLLDDFKCEDCVIEELNNIGYCECGGSIEIVNVGEEKTEYFGYPAIQPIYERRCNECNKKYDNLDID